MRFGDNCCTRKIGQGPKPAQQLKSATRPALPKNTTKPAQQPRIGRGGR